MSWSWRSNSSSKRTGRRRLATGLRRITRPARKLTAAERAAVEERLRNDGILPRTNERI
jgi:hypothetical protein